jgi:hypothetical protein
MHGRYRIITANAVLRDVTCWPPGGATVHALDRKTDFLRWADGYCPVLLMLHSHLKIDRKKAAVYSKPDVARR